MSPVTLEQQAPTARRLLGGVTWVALARIAPQILQLGAGVVLARTLTPGDFGVAATVYIFVGLAGLLNDGGLARALLHKDDLQPEDLSTAFWVNAALGGIMAAALAFGVTFLTGVYGEPRLVPLTWIVASAFVLNVTVVPAAMLERALQYRVLAMCDIASAASGILASLVALFFGAGVFSLVVSSPVDAIVRSILLFAVTRWRPSFVVRSSSLRYLWSFSGFYSLSSLLYFVQASAASFAVGLRLGPTEQGLYVRAQTLAGIPPQIPNMVGAAVLPALAALRRDGRDTAPLTLRAQALVSLVACQALGWLLVVAHLIVPLVYGPQWTGASWMLVSLAFAGLYPVIASPSMWGAFVRQRTDLLFRWQLAMTAVTVVVVALGIGAGLQTLVLVLPLSQLVLLLPAVAFGARISGISLRAMLSSVAPGLALGATAAGLTALLRDHLVGDLSPWADLAMLTTLYLTVSTIGVIVLDLLGRPVFPELRRVLRRRQPAMPGALDACRPDGDRHGRFAYVVMAHRDLSQVVRLVGAIKATAPESDVLVLWNGPLDGAGTAAIRAAGGSRVGSGKRARWGDYSLVERMVEGFEAGLGYDWTVLVSGQDYPARHLGRWEDHLREQDVDAVFEARPLEPGDDAMWDRVRYDWLLFQAESRLGRLILRVGNRLLPAQLRSRVAIFDGRLMVGLRRRSAPSLVWKGSTWMAVDRDMCRRVVDAARDRQRNRPFRRSLNPDETFIQTILGVEARRPLVASITMTRWQPGSPHPDDLGPDDLRAALAAGTPFTRKVTGPRGQALADLLDDAVHGSTSVSSLS